MSPIISPKVWITREGQEIEIAKMASSHLLMAIHMMERNRFTSALEVYEDGIRNGVDMSDAVEYYSRWPIQYETMIREAQRRGLISRSFAPLETKKLDK